MNHLTIKYKVSTEAVIYLNYLDTLTLGEIKKKYAAGYPNFSTVSRQEWQLVYWMTMQRKLFPDIEISFESKSIPTPLRSN
jgi:hypothetical protein